MQRDRPTDATAGTGHQDGPSLLIAVHDASVCPTRVRTASSRLLDPSHLTLDHDEPVTNDAARRTAALAELPIVHGLALRLSDEGEPPDRIAKFLGVEPETVGPLLEVASAKLEEILGRDEFR